MSGGIELSEMTEDLVFDDRPVSKPKAASPSQPAQVAKPAAPVQNVKVNQPAQLAQPASSFQPEQTAVPKQDVSQPVLTAKIRPPEPDVFASDAVPSVSVANNSTPQLVQPPPAQVTQQNSQTPMHQTLTQQTSTQQTPTRQAPMHQTPAQNTPVQQSSTGVAQFASTQQSVVSNQERRVTRSDASTTQKKEAIDLFETLIASASKGGASDLILKCGQVPMFRWNGELFPSRNGPRLEGSFLEILSASILSQVHCEKLNDLHDVDFSFQSTRGGRIRVNIFRQCGEMGLVARLIPTDIPNFEKLELDPHLKHFVDQRRGLVLVTGATGSGKSTTLAAMLDYINNTRTSHIITIEDPIEFVHHDKRSVFNQRELGLDTRSYADALRSALRQAPDVILVGELRDAETAEIALQAAETGHLVLSTLHTNDAADSILRILGMVGQEKEAVVRVQLADCLRGVISQRLIKRADRNGRVAAQEVMVNTATIRERLLKGSHPSVVRDFIAQGGNYGMHTFDQHLIQLVKSGVVEYEEALRNASNRDDFILRFSGVSDGREAS